MSSKTLETPSGLAKQTLPISLSKRGKPVAEDDGRAAGWEADDEGEIDAVVDAEAEELISHGSRYDGQSHSRTTSQPTSVSMTSGAGYRQRQLHKESTGSVGEKNWCHVLLKSSRKSLDARNVVHKSGSGQVQNCVPSLKEQRHPEESTSASTLQLQPSVEVSSS
jgi:hypothetical protein